ncbi:FAD-binding domain-containing protein [Aaosphaeria arxii CBS 175.79]|uniref:FAD-binding domain-containing protein n=1 Tax=Aaosphaeria arxii CBS 175.79 TaxID=1450172 RepID=A0A6A5Y4S0_9PLEO|nr:FAD-binding domain-containing protein [Aaosphaeria arxii CBS 175.79]KAF2019871.1 FAD-binding domain-containing protein [Aaosphaeria arxii CBS 175.79]
MRLYCAFTLCTSVLGVFGQARAEPANRNATQALLDNGVASSIISSLTEQLNKKSPSTCSVACNTLKAVFGSDDVLLQDEAQYKYLSSAYWSQQQALVTPICIFTPSKAIDVSTLVLISQLSQCPFAVKSGGHAAFSGASNIEDGITVVLEKMKNIELSKDKKTAAIGPGNIWYDVYTTLESHNLAVIGGRVAAIGVGGLTLGGGISFFSNIHGWACDSVVSFEVVTASGVVLDVSAAKHSDLFWALRGGGNNFGIVTKFTLKTFPQGQMWGGGKQILEPGFPAVIKAFYNLGMNAASDPNAGQILSFAYVQNTRIASADLQYANPIANAAILAEYMAIPSIGDTTKVRSLADLTVQFNSSNPSGLRETYWAATFKLDEDMTTFIKDIFFEEISLIADASALIPAATLQVITTPQLENMERNGGNALGLSAKSGPFILLNLNNMWAEAGDDARVLKANANIIQRTVAEAKRRNLHHEYIYMNYASQFQAVIPSYGAENQRKLKAIARKYDPTEVFQRWQPGYFKLDGSPSILS